MEGNWRRELREHCSRYSPLLQEESLIRVLLDPLRENENDGKGDKVVEKEEMGGTPGLCLLSLLLVVRSEERKLTTLDFFKNIRSLWLGEGGVKEKSFPWSFHEVSVAFILDHM